MTNFALIIMASLPASWTAVGCVLIAVTLIAVVLFVFKSREVATLKKEVEELRDTMRMMRYEEANLSRMLHTVDRSANSEDTEEPEAAPSQDTPSMIECDDQEEETRQEADEPEEPETEVPEENIESDSYEMEEEPEAPATEPAVAVAIVAENAIEEEETDETPAAAEVAATEEVAEEEEVEEEFATETTELIETEESTTEIPEETAEEVLAEESEEEATENSEGVKDTAVEPQVEPLVKPRKQAINERRPAIPTDLFAAWFEENEQAEQEEKTAKAEVIKVAEAETTVPAETPEETEATTLTTQTAIAEPLVEQLVTEEPSAEEEPASVVAQDSYTEEEASAVVPFSKEDERFCRKLERIVNSRMKNPNLNIDVIAAQFGIGRTNFYRKVRELMGMSPNDYLRKCRMERAAELLCNSELTVADVCTQVGIPDAQYFSRVFKSYFGTPPSAYREQKSNG